ncbi:hypothetical protein B7494_g4332 [Chlorociboria aeruginascens]|nr:hypothetical protein B7494_g4332 [Chlorociboria aeruginascens]
MSHLSSPAAIFSPSLARQQLAAAKDWNYVDNWLSAKFNGKTPPAFERNSDTLKALLALAAVNESADEERELLARVEAKVLLNLQAKEESNSKNEQLLDSMEASLTQEGHASLDALSSFSVALNQPVPEPENLARTIIHLQVTAYDLDQARDRVEILQKHLDTELDRINALMKELRSDAYQAEPKLGKQTVDYQRKSKALVAKLSELQDRVVSLSSMSGRNVTIQDIKAEEDQYRELMMVTKDLEAHVKKYHGLPQDTDLARLELESLRLELHNLTRERDGLFEGLVERESPKKTRS